MFNKRLSIVFILQRFLGQLVLITTVAVIYAIAEKQCRSRTTQIPKDGHRCVTASKRYTIIQNVPARLCTHICMQRENCNIINYNHEGRYCQLTSEVCLKIVEDPVFTVIDFSCLRWVTIANVVDEMLILCNKQLRSFTSRLVLQSDILVGTCYKKGDYTFVWKNVTGWKSGDYNGEILQILPWCSVIWIPYVPGDPIPVGAVVGGYLGDDPSVETYIISGESKLRPRSCGYYNPRTELGYRSSMKAGVMTNIMILVLQEK